MGKGILFQNELMLKNIEFRVSAEKRVVHGIIQDLVIVLFFYIPHLKQIMRFFHSSL